MSGTPNFEAYRRYLAGETTPPDPVTVIDGGRPGTRDDYIIVDYDGFRGLNAAQTARLTDKFSRAATDGRYDSDPTPGFKADVAAAQDGKKLLYDSSGGINHREQNVILIDSKTLSFRQATADIAGIPLSAVASPQEKLYAAFARAHETAHEFLNVEEAGADYVASKRLLEQYPGADTKQFLQTMADMRTLSPYRSSEADIANTRTYGYGCADAIRAAIAENGSGHDPATIEDRYGNALAYDSLNSFSHNVAAEGFKGRIRPEAVVRKALLDVDPSLDDQTYKAGGMAKAAQKLLDEGKFETGSPQNHILEDIVGASRRFDTLYGQSPRLQNASAPQPSVSPNP